MTRAVDETVSFIADVLRDRSADVLEVGCGEGAVARALVARGHRVVGLDADEEAVEAARAAGVDAHVVRWPEFSDTRSFDAVVFTRSLHHINPLNESVARAAEVLRENGLLILEDFAFADIDPDTVREFSRRLAGVTLDDEFLINVRDSADPMTAWHYAHSHELHRWSKMKKAIARHFTIEREWTVPYLYRYVPPMADEIFGWEETLGERTIGRRLVASLRRRDGGAP